MISRIRTSEIDNYYCHILRQCVSDGTIHFNSSWFYGKFRGAPLSILKAMKKCGLITNRHGTHVWYLNQMWSQVRYIGLCIASKLGEVTRQDHDSYIPFSVCAKKTKLQPAIIAFLCKTTHLTTEHRSNILEMTPTEVQLLEDYFYMRLGTIAIQENLQFDFHSPDDLSIFMNLGE